MAATFDKLVYADGGSHRRDGFDDLARDWVKRFKFDPEQLAGQPLRSRASIGLDYVGASKRGNVRAEALQRALESRECQVAGGREDGPVPVVEDSPIKVLKTS